MPKGPDKGGSLGSFSWEASAGKNEGGGMVLFDDSQVNNNFISIDVNVF